MAIDDQQDKPSKKNNPNFSLNDDLTNKSHRSQNVLFTYFGNFNELYFLS
jgi:hypothetical protein